MIERNHSITGKSDCSIPHRHLLSALQDLPTKELLMRRWHTDTDPQHVLLGSLSYAVGSPEEQVSINKPSPGRGA
ncbi:hypothetical protein FB565_008782 [Actinoplanes lutulentus]|nr:hypothetical protein [Actinoplanes lutulentus]MBB2948996.1 hypothetical protein [Actinoplanes lutulentus]